MKPDGIVRCIASYKGLNYRGETLMLQAGKQYIKTTGPNYIYLNDFDQPARQLPWLTPEDYAKLAKCLG